MKSITIVQLYPEDMNIYGDWGNVLTLKKRLERQGYAAEIIDYNVGNSFPAHADIIIGGGGQDSGQLRIVDDLLRLKKRLHELADAGTPMLVICGLYQLFGNSFTTSSGDTLEGISIFNATTKASSTRLIGNIVVQTKQFGEVIGFENHSGLTTLDKHAKPLGTTAKNCGNNGEDLTEGARHKNVIGTYLHGSLLPKNPRIADWLIEKAVTAKYGAYAPKPCDDTLAEKAREQAIKRPR